MTVIYNNPVDLTIATEAGEWYEFSQHPCWKRMRDHMQELVGEAKDNLDGCISSDPQVHLHLNVRHQQRNAMMVALTRLVEDWNLQRNQIIEEAVNGNTDSD